MGSLGWAAGVALATVFTVSALAKLLDRPATREAVVAFGVPEPLAGSVAALLPPAELATAFLLVIPGTRLLGVLAAGLLLAGFTGAVLLALATGRRPDCRCFGRLGGADISGRTLARNAVLLTLVAVGGLGLLADPNDDVPPAWALGLGALVAAAVLGAEALAGRAARRRRDAADEAAFERGAEQTVAPPFHAPNLVGGTTSLGDLLAAGRPLLIVTLSPGCGPCKRLRPDVASWATLFADRLTVAVLATGDLSVNQKAYAEWPHLPVLVDEGGVRRSLGTTGTPSAVVVAPDGRLASGVAAGERLVRRLLVTALTGAEPVEGPGEPQEFPEEWPTADQIDLAAVVGRRPGVEQHALGEGTMLLHPASGASVVLDRTGALVWSVIDASSPLEEIVHDLVEVFDVPVEVVGRDVLMLTRSLAQAGLLHGVRPAPAAAASVTGRVDP